MTTVRAAGSDLRRPALYWALLHVPIIVVLYASPAARALAAVPEHMRAGTVLALLIEAVALACLPFVLTLPLSAGAAVYRWAAPLATGLATVFCFVDSRLYDALEFHVNGFFFRALMQHGTLREVGLSVAEVAVVAAGALGWIGLDALAGRRFLARFAGARRTWGWVAVLIALPVADRLLLGSLTFFGGPAVYAAGLTLPLQVPLHMNGLMARLTRQPRYTVLNTLDSALRESADSLHEGLDPRAVRFARTPDVVLVTIESLRADFLDSLIMPRLWHRAQEGAWFTRHYASATSTSYALFSLFFGLESQKVDAIVGKRRAPLLFGALRANGYRSRLLAASSVDWMGIKQTVFAAVTHDLETEFRGPGAARDSAMLASARRFVMHTGQRPLFLFLFFDGTHFNYSFPGGQAPFRPYWNGAGRFEAAPDDAALIRNRAKNAAYEVDRKLDAFLAYLAAMRGRAPLVIVTGDHGEEFREHGRIGHGSDVSEQQVHVPMVVLGDGVPRGRFDAVTSHIDVVPTLLGLLGDTHAPDLFADGLSMFAAPPGRFVLTTVGWEPTYAAVGDALKVRFSRLDAGFATVEVTDPEDGPVPDGDGRFAAVVPAILRAFTGSSRAVSPAGRASPEPSVR